ncbi:hypothetical protein CYMTET_54830 [Cymbomonas tetramitiformis]|uniref:F-box domain-containing protein n=1 Tax=Cymbomonas tetramitiformis TaxID=36881 RepID=A0AAE0EP69_9CHLO|nr:hypothetical protein CYMTET_54830 [Cymbomonas tetramitiformis]
MEDSQARGVARCCPIDALIDDDLLITCLAHLGNIRDLCKSSAVCIRWRELIAGPTGCRLWETITAGADDNADHVEEIMRIGGARCKRLDLRACPLIRWRHVAEGLNCCPEMQMVQLGRGVNEDDILDLASPLFRKRNPHLRSVEGPFRPQTNFYLPDSGSRVVAYLTGLPASGLFQLRGLDLQGKLRHAALGPLQELLNGLGELLRHNGRALQLLDLSENQLCPSGVDAIVDGLAALFSRAGALSALNVSGNNIHGHDAEQLAYLAVTHPTLEVFCEIPVKRIKANTLTEVDLRFANIDLPGALALAKLLGNNRSLRTLNLLHNALGLEGARAIVRAFEDSGTLLSLCGLEPGITTLDPSRNLRLDGQTRLSGMQPWDLMLLCADLKKGPLHCSLTSLDLSGTNMTCEDVAALAEALFPAAAPAFYGSLQTLNLADNCCGNAGATALAEKLAPSAGKESQAERESNVALRTLDLRGNPLGHRGRDAILGALRRSRTLTSVCGIPPDATAANLSACALTPEDGRLLAGELSGHVALTALDVSGNHMSDSLGQAAYLVDLMVALKTNTLLTALNLQDSALKDGPASSVAEGLMSGTSGTLSALDMSHNLDIGWESASVLARAVLALPSLRDFGGIPVRSLEQGSVTALDLTGGAVGLPGALVLSELLTRPGSALASLRLDSNGLGAASARTEERPEGVRALGEALRRSAALTSLSLRDNFIGWRGAAAFAAGLGHGDVLRALVLDGNPLGRGTAAADGDEEVGGFAALGDALLRTTALTSLSLRAAHVGPPGLAALSPGLRSSRSLETLDLGGNPGLELLRGLELAQRGSRRAGGSLRTVNLLGCRLAKAGRAAALAALKQSATLVSVCGVAPGLTALDLSCAGLGLPDAELLAGEMARRQRPGSWGVTSLNLLHNDLEQRGAEAIVAAFKRCAPLRTLCGVAPGAEALDLSGEDFYPWDAMLLAADLGKRSSAASSLRTLNVRFAPESPAVYRHNHYDSAHFFCAAARLLCAAAQRRPAPLRLCGALLLDVRELDLSEYDLSPADALLLANDLKHSTALHALDISGHELYARYDYGDFNEYRPWEDATEHLRDLAAALLRDSSVETVTVSRGKPLPIGPLRRNELAELDHSGGAFGSARLTAPDLVVLGAALAVTSSLHTLNLSGHALMLFLDTGDGMLDTAGAEALADGLGRSKSLRTLILDGCTLAGRDEHGGIGVTDEFGGVYLVNEGMRALGDALERTTTLTSLSLKGNFIGPVGGAALAAGLRANRSLQSLDLSNNDLAARSEGRVRRGYDSFDFDDSDYDDDDLDADDRDADDVEDLQESLMPLKLLGQRARCRLASLRVLELGGNGIDGAGVEALVDGGVLRGPLCALCLRNNLLDSLTVEGSEALGKAVMGSAALRSLDLSLNGLQPAHLVGLVAGGLLRGAVSALVLHGNALGGDAGQGDDDEAAGFEALAAGLQGNTCLTELDLGATHMGPRGAAALGGPPRLGHGLTALNLVGNSVGPEGADALVAARKRTPSLKTLCGLQPGATTVRLAHRPLGPWGAVLLASDLDPGANGESARTLLLGDQEIGSAAGSHDVAGGFRAISGVLKGSTALAALSLRPTKLGPRGAAALAEGLGLSQSLTSADLQGDLRDLGAAGAAILIEAFRKSGTLTTLFGLEPDVRQLDMSGQNLGPWGAMLLAAELRMGRRGSLLHTVDLQGNALAGRSSGGAECDDGLRALVAAFGANPRLTSVSLRDNGIGSRCAAALAQGLPAGGVLQLRLLDLRGNPISKSDVRNLQGALMVEQSSCHLEIDFIDEIMQM